MYESFARRNQETKTPSGWVIRWKLPGKIDQAFVMSLQTSESDIIHQVNAAENAADVDDLGGFIELSAKMQGNAAKMCIRTIIRPNGEAIELDRERVDYGGMKVSLLTDQCVGDLLFGSPPFDEELSVAVEMIIDEFTEALPGLSDGKKNGSSLPPESQDQASSPDADPQEISQTADTVTPDSEPQETETSNTSEPPPVPTPSSQTETEKTPD